MIRSLLLGTLLLIASTARAQTPPALPERLELYVGDTHVLEVRSQRVAVGDGEVVDVSSLDGGQLLFLAQAPGTTAVTLWLRDGRRHRVTVTVTPQSLDLVLEHVRRLLDGVPNVTARIAGSRVVVEGERVPAADQKRVAAVVESFGGAVVDFVGRLPWEPMLHFDVRIVEVRRSAIRELGVRWDTTANGPSLGVIADFDTNDLFRVVPEPAPPGLGSPVLPKRVWPPATYAGLASTLGSRIALLESRGDAVLIAQPTLSCRSGGQARFVAGGEFPIPVTDGLGSTDVEFKEYGVILDVKPVADRGGAIWASVETEVSQIDESVRVLGVPGLLKRRSATEINLREGEVVVLAGLASRSHGRDTAQVPGLGSVPVLGNLFRSRQRREQDTELLILITPRVVRPTEDPAALANDPNAAGVSRARELEARGAQAVGSEPGGVGP
ncbi:MAG: pilus assembly protein N-terminal domain-containing protein [Steroidobacteraceae bacterium]|jgi:pilus assembly protein CpaC|nr:pilus assembly protein N-terminal domain-containing protein [Steroidobacteraceae bacterium]